jgi:Glycosyl transferase family 2
LDAFGAALRDRGLTVEESVDHFPPPADDLVYLFVPHEYHPLVHELAHPTLTQLQRSVAVCTEQPGSSWFDVSSELAAQAGAVVDINVLGAKALADRGIAVEYAPLGYVPLWDAWHGGERERPIALTFLGAYNERRAEVVARCAPILGGHRAAIHMVESAQPHTADAPSFLARERKWRLLADAQVLLNVHQDPRPYLEWHRVIGAVANGCVVLSEHSIGTEPFVPGEHFVSARYEDLPHVLAGLLADPDCLDRIRHAAYELLREQMPIADTVDTLLRAVERAAATPVGPSPPAPGPMPKPLPPRTPGWEAEAEIIGEQLPIRTALKHLVVQSRKLERQIKRLQPGSEPDDEVTVERLGHRQDKPRVSVLLTVYNYADYVGQALRSVALSELSEIEVVVVDDASSDHSVDAIHAASHEFPWLSMTVVRRARNAGLSAARNLAAEHAEAELLFVLDADNEILPAGLRLLADAMDENPDAVFVYGIIETFDTNGPLGLVSWLDWDPTRLRYGNYIDAMAMIRKSALLEVGGYSTDTALSMGWEDFALWVAMADRGMSAVRVPDFVGRYRVNPHSMLSLTDIDNSAVWAALLRKYPSLGQPLSAQPLLQPA